MCSIFTLKIVLYYRWALYIIIKRNKKIFVIYWRLTEAILWLLIGALEWIFSNTNITEKRSTQYLPIKHSEISHLDKQRRGNIQKYKELKLGELNQILDWPLSCVSLNSIFSPLDLVLLFNFLCAWFVSSRFNTV